MSHIKAFPFLVKLVADINAKVHNHTQVFRHTGEGEYWVDNGCWGMKAKHKKDGTLVVYRTDGAISVGSELVPATRKEYLDCVGRYGTSDSALGITAEEFPQLQDALAKLTPKEVGLICIGYKRGLFKVKIKEDGDLYYTDDMPF
jgi:hypothetical protein